MKERERKNRYIEERANERKRKKATRRERERKTLEWQEKRVKRNFPANTLERSFGVKAVVAEREIATPILNPSVDFLAFWSALMPEEPLFVGPCPQGKEYYHKKTLRKVRLMDSSQKRWSNGSPLLSHCLFWSVRPYWGYHFACWCHYILKKQEGAWNVNRMYIWGCFFSWVRFFLCCTRKQSSQRYSYSEYESLKCFLMSINSRRKRLRPGTGSKETKQADKADRPWVSGTKHSL